MSTDDGAKAVASDLVRDAQAIVEAAEDAVDQQDLFGNVLPEDIVDAREELGPDAKRMEVLRHARKKGRGRPKGARNRRTEDFRKYIMQFGQHPAITLMQIQSTPPEVLIEASKQEKVHSFRKDGTPNVVIERMSYDQAQSLRKQCADILLPFIESKMPVAVDLSAHGDFNLLIPGVNISESDARSAADTGEIPFADYSEVEDGEDFGGGEPE